VNELARQHLAPLKLKGLVVAGSASLKNELVLDPPLQSLILKVVDVEYGGEQGFHQAITAVAEDLRNVPLVQEKMLVSAFMDEIAKDTNKYAFGLKATLQVLDMGVAERVLVWDKLPLLRCKVRESDGREQIVLLKKLTPPHKGVAILSSSPLIDWLVENAAERGAELCMISNASPEGSQFCIGFGGLGAMLRYPIALDSLAEGNEEQTDWEEEGGSDDNSEI